MTTYRISRWVDLCGQFDQIRFRKVLTAMSVGAVDARWMSKEAHLSVQEQAALLQQLRLEGVLIEMPLPTLDISVEEPFFLPPQNRRSGRGLLAHVGVWLFDGGSAQRHGSPATSNLS